MDALLVAAMGAVSRAISRGDWAAAQAVLEHASVPPEVAAAFLADERKERPMQGVDTKPPVETDQAAETPAVFAELDFVDHRIRRLEHGLQVLIERLAPVLSAGQPCNLGEPVGPSGPAVSPLADRIAEQSRWQAVLADSVEDTIARLTI